MASPVDMKMEVGGEYKTVRGVTVSIIGRKLAGPKATFIDHSGTEYDRFGHVVGFSQHVNDLQLRARDMKEDA